MSVVLIFLIAALVLAFALVGMSVRVIKQNERGVVERLGRFQKTLAPGLRLIMPFVDIVHSMDMRERVIDVPPQLVITKDNVGVEVDAVIFAQVTDPVRAFYEIDNYVDAATKLAQTNLRNLIGELDLDQCLSSRDRINGELRDVLDTATDKWGVRINRIELQRIDPPADIQEAMGRQMKAERDKRAAVFEAEGRKLSQILDAQGRREAQILDAEGHRQAQILDAEGYAQAVKQKADAEKYRQITVAEGEAMAIGDVFTAIHSAKPDKELITLKYLEMLPKLASGDANKIFLPYEATGIISALSAMVEGIKTSGSPTTNPTGTPTGNSGGGSNGGSHGAPGAGPGSGSSGGAKGSSVGSPTSDRPRVELTREN